MKDILLTLIKSIVDAPDAVSIDEMDDNGFVTLTITVAQEDMGKVIGKEGKVIRALRNVMKIPAMKQQKKVQLQLAE
jgi:predicted RNA-binding protein YlqC (UPF0109 family)